MSKKSLVALVVCIVIWVVTLLFAFCAYSTTKGYSLFALSVLPFSLLIYLSNYFDCDDTLEDKEKKKEKKNNDNE